MEKQTFEIPSGCTKVTIEQIGNTIVTSFESEKYVPKVGDYVKVYQSEKLYNIGRVSHVAGDLIYFRHPYILSGKVWIEKKCAQNAEWFTFEQITPEELQAEFKKLGYEYNFETHKATKIKWKPKDGELYYCVSTECKVIKVKNYNCYGDIEIIKIGNCYRTPEEAEPRRQHYLAFKD
jgi:hypothetical protein